MFLTAIDILNDQEMKPQFNVKVILDFEEELGSPNLPDAIEVHREALSADKMVILDGSRLCSPY